MAKKSSISKGAFIEAVTDATGKNGTALTKKQVRGALDAIAGVAYKELKKNGILTLPGFAKFVVVKKAARPARQGINPFTGQQQTFKAKPASKTVRARPVKAIKEVVA